MSSFSATLSSLMKDAKVTQSDLAERAGVWQSQVSDYVNDNGLPEEEVLTKLCGAFGKESGTLLAAWLRDKVPAKLIGQVEILPVKKSGRAMEAPAQPSAYSRLPRRTRALIDEVAATCERDAKFVAAIETTVNLTKR